MAKKSEKNSTLILGIGNILMGDEGLGVHVVRYLQQHYPLSGVDLLDGGTGGFHLLEYFQSYEHVILIDATIDDQPPGTVSVLQPKFSSDYPTTLTAHDIGLKDLLDALYLTGREPRITLFAVSIALCEEVKLDISPEIQQAIPKVAKQIVDYLQSSQ